VPGNREPTNDLWEALYTQRAIRYFRPDPVPQDVIFKCIEAATRAPSGSNLQPWGWVVVRDDAMRARIAGRLRELFLGNEQMRTYVESGRASGDRSRRLMMGGVSNIVERLDSAPVFIIPCLHNAASPAPQGLLAGSSIYQAVQNLMLAARGLGLGTVMTTFQAGMSKDLAAWLKLPEDAISCALIPMGYPAANFGPVSRKPVEEVTYWETWGTTQQRGEA
jgi:nitroreductase